MTPLEQVRHIEETINQFQREIECLRLDVKRREDEIKRIHQVGNEIQKAHPELWTAAQTR